MKLILVGVILGTVLSETWAGVGVTTPEVEEYAYRLWNQFCNADSDGGNQGNQYIYCKRARGVIRQNLQHVVQLRPQNTYQDQVVFIQPPSYHYKHDVIVTGGGGSAPRTVIYVKNVKNTHAVNVRDQTQSIQQERKPQLFFLRGNHGGQEESGSVPQTTPAPTYLPPATYLPPSTRPPPTYLPPSTQTPPPAIYLPPSSQPPATYLPPTTEPPATYLPPTTYRPGGYRYKAPRIPFNY